MVQREQLNSQEILSSLYPRSFNSLFVVFIAILCAAVSWLFIQQVKNYETKIQEANFLSNVHILAAAVNLDDVRSLTGKESDRVKQEYIDLKGQLFRVVKASPKLRFAYLMGKQGNDIVFLVDSESEDSRDYSPPGQIYKEASVRLRGLFKRGEGLVEGPLQDQWGTWVSALIPLRNPQTQEILAVMGLDVDASIWQHDIRIYELFSFVIAVSFFGIIFISFYFVQKQRQILARVAVSEERFRHVVDGTGDWIWETNAQGLYIYSSHAVKDILGYDPVEVVGKKYFYDFCFPEKREQAKKGALEALEKGDTVIEEMGRRCHKDGHEIILDIKGFAIRDKKGRITGYYGVDRDITERKRNEEYTLSLARFPSETPNHILRITHDGTILYVNDASKSLLGHWKIGLRERVPSEWRQLIVQALEENTIKDFDATIEDKIISFSIMPVKETDYVNVYGRDVTARKKMEHILEENRKALEVANQDLAANEKLLRNMIKDMEQKNKELRETQNQLIQSEKMATVGVLASGVAHEIKNPLAIILQGIERVEKIFGKEEQKGLEYASMVRNAAIRANRVINALLKFSRSSQLELAAINIQEVIDAAVVLIENTAKLTNIKIKTQYGKNIKPIPGDAIILQQVFFDLFTNAIDAMPQGGEVLVTTKMQEASQGNAQEPEKVLIEVKDTGTGIPPEHISKIFDPFFTTKEPGKGTGLGLSTVYLILEKHQGTIQVESSPNVGTSFLISLPVIQNTINI